MRCNKVLDMHHAWMNAGKFLVFLFVPLFLAGCQGTKTLSPTPDVGIIDIQVTNIPMPMQITMEPYTFRTSQPGTAALHGNLVVLDPSMILPAENDAIYLVPISQDTPGASSVPQFIEDDVPQADVNEHNGEFMFTDIQVGRYIVMVVTMGGAQIPVRTMDDAHNLVVVKVDETFLDKITEIGTMSLP